MIDDIQCNSVFEQIEHEFDVNSLTYGSIVMWPYIRRWLRLRLAFKSYRVFSDTHVKKISVSIDSKNMSELVAKKSIDALLYAPEPIHNEIYAEKRFAPYLDSIIPLLKSIGRSYLKLSVYEKNDEDYLYPVHHLEILRTELNEPATPITKFDEFKQYLTKFGVDDIKENYFLKCGRECESYADLFENVLTVLAPKVIFFSCYYTDIEGTGLIMAARKLGIKTVDIQHGIIKKHPVYSHYSTIPDGGYCTMPSHYWTWGAITCDYLEQTYNSTADHTPFVGGNVKGMKLHYSESEVLSTDILHEEGQDEKTVLVALQYPCLGKVVLEAMKSTGESIHWILRLHPRFSSTQNITELEAEIKEYNISRKHITFSLPSDQQIYTDLEGSYFVVTYFSTVVYEALMHQVIPIIVDPRGKALYEDEIESGAVLYTEDSSTLLQMISGDSCYSPSDSKDYVNVDPAVAKKALLELFGA